MKIVIVGPCLAGKTTLAEGLQARGYEARTVVQEHSYVPYLWALAGPDVLVYLDCTAATARQREPVTWGEEHVEAQHQLLRHAREHCHLYVRTDDLRVEEVLARVLEFLDGFEARTPRGGPRA